MSIIDGVFGNSAQILSLRAQRSELITSNLANADTPGYKAVDIDFESVLSSTSSGVTQGQRTHENHIAMDGGLSSQGEMNLSYRTPNQPRLDGNTVETDTERMAFTDNALRYQATLNFLDGRIKSIVSTLRGD